MNLMRKKSLPRPPISAFLLASYMVVSPLPSFADVVISQYIEGSSFNKAIEIFNSGDSIENLSYYELIKYQNGDIEQGKSIPLNAINLAPGDVYVLTHSSAADSLLAVADQVTGSLNFNGDDPITLVRVNDLSVVDTFGVFGDVDFAKDVTYSRVDFASAADHSWEESAWLKSGKDDFNGLGFAPTTDQPVSSQFSCNGQFITPIYDIQGNGDSSPLIAEGSFQSDPVYTSGVVTSVTTDLYSGFFIQDRDGDGNSDTSDGIFVYSTGSHADLNVGDEVCIFGTVSEYYGSTQISLIDNSHETLSEGNEVQAVPLTLNNDALLHDQLEPYEGMLVTTNDSDLIVSRPFSFDFDAYRSNMVMSYKKPIYKSTHIFVAETEQEKSLAADNEKSTLYIETDSSPEDGDIPYFDDFNGEDGYIRVGDKIANLEGVLSYSYGQYRLIASAGLKLQKDDFSHLNDRTENGLELGHIGNLRVASFNVLNLFNSPYGGTENPYGSNRGAETQAEFELQLSKITHAISLLDADIVGLMEIENNGFSADSAIATLVDSINANQPASALPYRYIKADESVGTDAISVGIIYRPGVVKPIHSPQKIALPEQHGLDINGEEFDKYQRVSLLQQFRHNSTHEKLNIVVNHFKSKGSACIEDSVEENNEQGNCNAFRVSAAVALGDYLTQHVKGNILALGDLNSYAKEDPIRVLTNIKSADSSRVIYTAEQTTLAGETFHTTAQAVKKSYNMISLINHFHGDDAYSYSFSGQLGSLDHALVNRQLLPAVVAVDDWHINAAETPLLEYSTENTGDLAKSDNAYSSSDHDPVVIEIDFKKKRKSFFRWFNFFKF